ncbi:O-antigen translocase [Flavobacterium agrisoli]|uniref:O-antigen translocase n=1 Tax=Flavobacterium agrisoli TaxID=2793066 RepID=A0A934PK24_9FLAO|nr:O-antigen translocase [Flavobacterium agrisoli]MBK0368755.1 O-antigen translocase [Flavobacterium agrisoli]
MIFNKIKDNKLLKVLSVNSLSVATSFILGMASTKIISFVLGTSGMAILGSFRNFTSMLKSITTLGMNTSLIKLYVENKNNKNELSVILSTFFWFFLIIALVVGFLTLVFAEFISDFIFFNLNFVLPIRVFSLLLPVIVLNVFWLTIYNGLEKINRIVAIQIISNIFIFCVTAILVWNKNIKGGLYALVLGELLMFIVTFIFVKKDKDYFTFELKKKINSKYLKIIINFSFMAFLSACIVPLTLILIRNYIVKMHSVNDAGLWDATTKLSSFYMSIFSSGLAYYYVPKLTSLKSNSEFKTELKTYFQIFVPLFAMMLLIIYLFRGFILNLVFTDEFLKIKEVLIWQLLGDLVRVMTLAFGYQILVKSRFKDYFIIEILFNASYLIISYFFVKNYSYQGALQSYFYANLITLIVILFMFRELFISKIGTNN